jgi:hypothetical protein
MLKERVNRSFDRYVRFAKKDLTEDWRVRAGTQQLLQAMLPDGSSIKPEYQDIKPKELICENTFDDTDC